jgi:hypothetical protein
MTVQTGPYAKALDVTPSDTVNIRYFLTDQRYSDALYIGGAGVVVAVWEDLSTTAFTCVAGQILPIKVKRVNATSTTATLIRALYY